jgi:hypothetical protein
MAEPGDPALFVALEVAIDGLEGDAVPKGDGLDPAALPLGPIAGDLPGLPDDLEDAPDPGVPEVLLGDGRLGRPGGGTG